MKEKFSKFIRVVSGVISLFFAINFFASAFLDQGQWGMRIIKYWYLWIGIWIGIMVIFRGITIAIDWRDSPLKRKIMFVLELFLEVVCCCIIYFMVKQMPFW